MKNFLNDFKSIIAGAKHLEETWTLSRASFGSAVIHFTFTLLFALYSMPFLVIYNIFVTAAYIAIGIHIIMTDNYKLMYFFTIIEVPFHSALASLLAGWECGFMLYTIAMVSVSFYFMLAIKDLHHKLQHPVISSLFIIVFFILTKHLCTQITPYYTDHVTPTLTSIFYYFNSIIAFSMSFLFSFFFTLEVFYTQKQLIQENSILDEMANKDPLTNLLNRRSMETHLNQVMEHAKKSGAKFTVIMGDIDDFKIINDTYGHNYGDKVLVAISDIIQTHMRSEDQLCRWGGEEFLILIHTSEQYAIKIVERIRVAISESLIPIDGTDEQLTVTMTFGVSSYMPGNSMNRMIQIADKNLYIGKNNGKNQVVSKI